jgi:hypothetical protein
MKLFLFLISLLNVRSRIDIVRPSACVVSKSAAIRNGAA